MELAGLEVLVNAKIAHPNARKAIASWERVVRHAGWTSIIDVRKVLPTADAVTIDSGPVVTVFNIRGNNFRLIASLSYVAQIVTVRAFLTHAEYDKQKWKRR